MFLGKDRNRKKFVIFETANGDATFLTVGGNYCCECNSCCYLSEKEECNRTVYRDGRFSKRCAQKFDVEKNYLDYPQHFFATKLGELCGATENHKNVVNSFVIQQANECKAGLWNVLSIFCF